MTFNVKHDKIDALEDRIIKIEEAILKLADVTSSPEVKNVEISKIFNKQEDDNA